MIKRERGRNLIRRIGIKSESMLGVLLCSQYVSLDKAANVSREKYHGVRLSRVKEGNRSWQIGYCVSSLSKRVCAQQGTKTGPFANIFKIRL